MTNIPSVLLPYQSEAIRLSHDHNLFVAEKSRRTGLTYGFAADAVLTASPAKGAMDVFYIAYNLDMTREFVGYCGDFAKAFGQVAEIGEFLWKEDGADEIKAFRIDFPSGKSIVALSSKPRSLRGKQGLVIIDEAAFHDQLDELIKAALALLMWGGRVVVISTHDGQDNAFATLIEDIRAGKRKGHVFRLTLSDALAQGLYKRICLRTGREWSPEAEAKWEAELRATYGEAAEEELDVIPARGSGVYLPRATIVAAMTADYRVVRLRAPDELVHWEQARAIDWISEWFETNLKPELAQFNPAWRSYVGSDFARSSDLSVKAFGQTDPLLTMHARLFVELRNVPYREQEWLYRACLQRLPLFMAAKMDATGNGGALAEAMQRDFGADRIEAIKITQQTYLDGMPRLKASIEARQFLMPMDEGTLDDLRMVKQVRGIPMVVDRRTDKADGAKGKRHGDSAIAAMMLRLAGDADVCPIEFASTGARASAAALPLNDRGFGSVGRVLAFEGW